MKRYLPPCATPAHTHVLDALAERWGAALVAAHVSNDGERLVLFVRPGSIDPMTLHGALAGLSGAWPFGRRDALRDVRVVPAPAGMLRDGL